MQSSAATAVSGSAVAGVTKLSRRFNSKQLSEFPQHLVSTSSSPPPSSAATNEEKKATLVLDGRLNFHVQKRRQPAAVIVKKAQESALPASTSPLHTAGDPRSVAKSQFSEVENSPADISSLDGSPSVVVAAAAAEVNTPLRRQSARLKRAAEEERSLDVKSLGATELSESSFGNARRLSKKKAVTAMRKPLVAETSLPASAGGLVQDSSATDFWHSSLSESSGALVSKGVVEAAVLPILAGKTLTAPEDVAVALEHLKSADPLLKTVIEMHERPKFEKSTSAFTSLARSIVFQQLATNAAAAIFGRLVTLCEGLDKLTPITISQLSKQQLRAIGISERKASYLHDLSANFLSGTLSDSSINDMDDEALMKALTAVKGIGVWSVHMFMLFSLHKPDVLPVGDLGVRKGFQKLYQLKELPTPAQVEKIASSWQPYRSVGSWYMWRVMSNTFPLKQTT